MISLDRLVELRSDPALVKRLDACTQHAVALIGARSAETLRAIVRGEEAALHDARRMHEAVALAVYEEARRPLIEFLRELDRSLVITHSPVLHQRLKELIK